MSRYAVAAMAGDIRQRRIGDVSFNEATPEHDKRMVGASLSFLMQVEDNVNSSDVRSYPI